MHNAFISVVKFGWTNMRIVQCCPEVRFKYKIMELERSDFAWGSGARFCKSQFLLQNLIFDFKTCPNYQKVT